MRPFHYLSLNCLLTLMVAAYLSSACSKAGETRLGVNTPEKERASEVPSGGEAEKASNPQTACEEQPEEQRAAYRVEGKMKQKLGSAFSYYASAREAMKNSQRHLLASVFILPVIREHQAELEKLIESFGALTDELQQIESIIKMNKFVQSWPFLETDFTKFLKGLSLSPSTQFKLGRRYYIGRGIDKDEQQAVKWCRKAAEQNHAQAQFILGMCYANGRGVEKDTQQAVVWYRKAEEQKHA